MQTSKPRHAFTLTEVLVVMMMLAILISLVLYASSGFSQSDALLRSQNNLREINQFMQHYTNSHDEDRRSQPVRPLRRGRRFDRWGGLPDGLRTQQ